MQINFVMVIKKIEKKRSEQKTVFEQLQNSNNEKQKRDLKENNEFDTKMDTEKYKEEGIMRVKHNKHELNDNIYESKSVNNKHESDNETDDETDDENDDETDDENDDETNDENDDETNDESDDETNESEEEEEEDKEIDEFDEDTENEYATEGTPLLSKKSTIIENKEAAQLPATTSLERHKKEERPYCIDISTSQVTSIKQLIEALKELIVDTSIIFDQTGIKIANVDHGHIVVIHMKLYASEFERYYCEQPILAGTNLMNLFKITKTINNGDTLTFFMEKNERNSADYLGIKIENTYNNRMSTFFLKLMDVDNDYAGFGDIEYNSIITMSSNEFKKIITDMYNFSPNVEIRNIANQLIFRCEGSFCELETIMTDNPLKDENTNEVKRNITIYNNNSEGITQGVFCLRLLSLFTKCTNLSSTVELNIGNNLPLVVHYNIATLGVIKLCVAPIVKK
jgi:proliferating cell nuclear antigen